MIALTAALTALSPACEAAPSNFGMLALWDQSPRSYEGRVPPGSLVVIGPAQGVQHLDATQQANWKAVIRTIRSQGGKVLGYIAMGHGGVTQDQQASFAAVPLEIAAYRDVLDGVDGFFFDQAGPDPMIAGKPDACEIANARWQGGACASVRAQRRGHRGLECGRLRAQPLLPAVGARGRACRELRRPGRR